MNINYEELTDWRDGARRELEREVEHLRERQEQMNNYLRALDATEELLSEIDELTDELERKQRENELLSGELEAKQAELDAMQAELERKQAEIDRLQLQQQLTEADAKPSEIHNHFETGCSAQVFNDKVTGRFAKLRKWDQREKRESKKKKRVSRKAW